MDVSPSSSTDVSSSSSSSENNEMHEKVSDNFNEEKILHVRTNAYSEGGKGERTLSKIIKLKMKIKALKQKIRALNNAHRVEMKFMADALLNTAGPRKGRTWVSIIMGVVQYNSNMVVLLLQHQYVC